MAVRSRILLQTTIPFVEDDWHIGRFSLLAEYLSSLKDDSGRVTGFMLLGLDITERKRIQAESAQKEAEFRFIFESAPIGLSWVWVGADGSRRRLRSRQAEDTGRPSWPLGTPPALARSGPAEVAAWPEGPLRSGR